MVGCTSHLELHRVACPPFLLYVPWCIRRLGTPLYVCLYLLHPPWLTFAYRLTSRFFLNLRSVVYDNRLHEQSRSTTVIALDNVQATTSDFLRTRRRKSRTGNIDTNAIVMDFWVERQVTVADEVAEGRRGGSLDMENTGAGAD